MPEQKTVKGGFMHFDSNAQQSRIVAFQFNPEMLERTITPVDPANQHGELIRFTLELDACDALERGDPTASAVGIHPALAALELLARASTTAIEQAADRTPRRSVTGGEFTLFVWGSQRVIPIKFMQLEIRETMFDGQLNPLRATVNVSLEFLSDAELNANPRARAFMDSYLRQKEWLAGQPGSSGPTEELLAAVKNKPSG
jgi:hypothetical protein